jgi:hypothetical protein
MLCKELKYICAQTKTDDVESLDTYRNLPQRREGGSRPFAEVKRIYVAQDVLPGVAPFSFHHQASTVVDGVSIESVLSANLYSSRYCT